MHAAHGAEWRAALHVMVFPSQILGAVLLQRNPRMPALLGAPVNEAILADVDVARARAAVPLVRLAVRKVPLKPVVVRVVERGFAGRRDLLEGGPLRLLERQQPAAPIVDDPGRRR